MEKSLLIQFLGENPTFKIVDFLIENKGLEVTKKDIIEGTKIARATLFKVWPQIEEQEIVRVTRKFGKTKLYTLNTESLIVRKILDLEKVLIAQSLEKSSKKELVIMR